MAHDGKILARARTALDERRYANRDEQQRRIRVVYSCVPEIGEIDAKLRGQMARLASLALSRRADTPEQLETLKRENLELQARRAELLVEHGWPMDYLDEIVSCPHCRDTGMRGDRICDCLEKLYNRELTEELSGLLRHGNESFEHFDLSLYSDRPDPATGIVPRKAMELNFAVCKRFAETFPAVKENLLLQGGTGLGKTYLSGCIARVVAAKGYSVCYDTAAAALDAFEKQKFSRDVEESESAADQVRRMLSCDLMILDDLGTEMVTAISISALYTLLNGRLVSGKRTIISTNCRDEELLRKYSPQICSRLNGEFVTLPFIGEDLRKK